MQTTWFIIMGISIRVGIDIARYAALRAQRQSNDGGRTMGKEPASPHAGTVAPRAPVANLPAAPLAYRWTWADDSTANVAAEKPVAVKRGGGSRLQSRTMQANHHEFVN
jgi:hypothetical protein